MNKIVILFFLFNFQAHAEDASCPTATAKQHFIESCTGYMEGRSLSGGGSPNRGKIKEECRCAALNFKVENLVVKNCEYDLEDIYVLMNMDRTKVACR